MDKQEWRQQCSKMLCEPVSIKYKNGHNILVFSFHCFKLPRLDDSMVLLLAALPQVEHDLLERIFELFENCDIKDQTVSRSKRGQISKLDCKGSYFKPLRAIEPEARKQLLQQVADGELSFSELAASCKYAKKMSAIQRAFMSLTQTSTWEEAAEKFPAQTRQKQLEAFLDLDFSKKATIPSAFVAYCQHAKRMLIAKELSDETSDIIKAKGVTAILLRGDVLTLETEKIVETLTPHGFSGFNLTLLDPPEVLFC